MVRRLLSLVLPLAGSALAVWLSTFLHIGITTSDPGTVSSTTSTVITVVLVALIFGLVNLTVKPIAKLVGFAFYLVTLGLIAIVVNGLLLLLTSWICGLLDIPFHVEAFWPGAVVGALFIGVVSWALNRVSDLITKKRAPARQMPPPATQPPTAYGSRYGR